MVTVAPAAANRLQPAGAWCLGRLFVFGFVWGMLFWVFCFNVYSYLFIWLCRVLVAACEIFSCCKWDLVS